MKKKLTSVVVKRVMWTISFLFIYVLGSRLTLPFVNVNDTNFLGGTTAFLAFSTAITGGNLRSLSLFSVGLSPWMSAMILWQMFSMSKKLGLGSLPLEVQDRRKMILTFVIAFVSYYPKSPYSVGGEPWVSINFECSTLNFRNFFLGMVIGFEFFIWCRWIPSHLNV